MSDVLIAILGNPQHITDVFSKLIKHGNIPSTFFFLLLSSSHHNEFHQGFLRQQGKLETKKLLIISTAIIITGLLTQIPNQLLVTFKVFR